jgi:hypothetical protein
VDELKLPGKPFDISKAEVWHPGSGCPQLRPACCDSPAVKVSHPHSNPQRLVAHLVDEPPVADGMPERAGGVGEQWAEPLHPSAHTLTWSTSMPRSASVPSR